MLKEIKRYIIENKIFFIILLVNFFAFYSMGEIYEIVGNNIVISIEFLCEYMCILNILMVLKYREVLEDMLVIIIFLLVSIDYFLINYLRFGFIIAIIFNIILNIMHIYILISNYKKTDCNKS